MEIAIRYPLWLCLSIIINAAILPATMADAQQHVPTLSRPAPVFTLKDVDGKPHTLTDYRGRPVALYFFCGCSWCSDVARQWGQMQQGDDLLSVRSSPHSPLTIVVFAGSADEVRQLAVRSGLDNKRTIFLPDPDMQVTISQYAAPTCPRAFVLDRKGIVRYTNNHAEDAARKAPAAVIAARTLAALHTNALPPAPISRSKPFRRSLKRR